MGELNNLIIILKKVAKQFKKYLLLRNYHCVSEQNITYNPRLAHQEEFAENPLKDLQYSVKENIFY